METCRVSSSCRPSEDVLAEQVNLKREGQRIKRTRLIQAAKYVVAVDVEMVNLFREIEERARQGDVGWLKTVGKVYAALEEAA